MKNMVHIGEVGAFSTMGVLIDFLVYGKYSVLVQIFKALTW